MPYGIVVFNQKTIGPIDQEDVLSTVTESNFHTLCEQYGLAAELLGHGSDHLHLNILLHGDLPVFQLDYRSDYRTPLTVYRWPASSQNGRAYMVQMQNEVEVIVDQEYLTRILQVILIEITRPQLEDLGILLAYEIARWAAFCGNGIMHALDGKWYRLNENKAFIPMGDV